MDGHFVPNLTIGAPVVKSLRQHTEAYLDCHLMVTDPEAWVQDFASAGASMYTFHLEAAAGGVPDRAAGAHPRVVAVAHAAREAGMHVGLALSPATPVEAVLPYLEAGLLDMVCGLIKVLILTVNPGFGGQKFMGGDVVGKCAKLRALYPDLAIQVDGGIAPATIAEAAAAGANVIVAGSAVFGAASPGDAIACLRSGVDDAAAAGAALTAPA